ncbi:hypothetical protein VP01_4661g1, partial [Puccinia sorghi]
LEEYSSWHQGTQITRSTPRKNPKPPTQLVTPTSGSKKSLLQILKQDHPAGFEHTKKRAVPPTPTAQQMSQRFSSTDEIGSAIDRGPHLVAFATIETLKQAKAQQKRLGKYMMQLSEFNIQYPDSLSNEAHKMCVIKTLRQLVSGGAYKCMNRAYDHYVHYSFAKVIEKEKKEKGKHFLDEERKNNPMTIFILLPAQRETIQMMSITPIKAYTSSRGFHFNPKLPTNSSRVLINRRRLQIEGAPFTLFPKPLKGLPLDFYNTDWFNNDSLRFKDHKKKLGDKQFTEVSWAKATEKYDLDFMLPEEVESDSEDSHDDGSDAKSIDLANTSGKDDNDKDSEYEESKMEAEDSDVQMAVGTS